MSTYKQKYTAYWGCNIQYKYPYLEKASRTVLEHLDVELIDSDEFTCCPEPVNFKTIDENDWLLMASRNLAIAEKIGHDMIVFCNGCFETFKAAERKLEDPVLRRAVNKKLEKIGLKYEGKMKIKHFLEVLHDDIGINKIKKHVKVHLNNLKIGTHPGCHLLRPSRVMCIDDPIEPTLLDEVVEFTGAKSLEYENKMLCCGGTLNTIKPDTAVDMVQTKLEELIELDADAIIVVCPFCFQQYDMTQRKLLRKGLKKPIPILFLTELLALAFECPVDFKMHKTPVKLKGMEKNELSEVKDLFHIKSLENCWNCGGCSLNCPVMLNDENVDFRKIIKLLVDGKLNEAVNNKEIWYCLKCYTCYELCPQNLPWVEIFDKLKELSIEKEIAPDNVKKGVDGIKDTGTMITRMTAFREELGLKPNINEPNMKEVKKILKGGEEDE